MDEQTRHLINERIATIDGLLTDGLADVEIAARLAYRHLEQGEDIQYRIENIIAILLGVKGHAARRSGLAELLEDEDD